MLLKYTAYVNWLNSCQSGKNLKVKNKTHHRIREHQIYLFFLLFYPFGTLSLLLCSSLLFVFQLTMSIFTCVVN